MYTFQASREEKYNKKYLIKKDKQGEETKHRTVGGK